MIALTVRTKMKVIFSGPQLTYTVFLERFATVVFSMAVMSEYFKLLAVQGRLMT